jgi:nicotinamide mononucleotide transporter
MDNWEEIFAVVTGLLYIFLEIKQKPVMWVVGFISSLVFVFVYFQVKVYGYAALYVYYVAVSVYGWYCWRYARQTDGTVAELQVSRLRLSLALVLALTAVVLFVGIGYSLNRFTDSPIPYLDALGVSLSMVATWMLARKILEHWMLWMFINFFSSVLCFSRELYPTAGLFVVYGVLSVVGWFKWK